MIKPRKITSSKLLFLKEWMTNLVKCQQCRSENVSGIYRKIKEIDKLTVQVLVTVDKLSVLSLSFLCIYLSLSTLVTKFYLGT